MNKQMTALTVKVLEVTAKTPVRDVSETDKFYTFKAYEYPNGVCSVSYEHTHDGFFVDANSIEACGLDEVVGIEYLHDFEMSSDAFKMTLEESINEFGHCEATTKAMGLVNNA